MTTEYSGTGDPAVGRLVHSGQRPLLQHDHVRRRLTAYGQHRSGRGGAERRAVQQSAQPSGVTVLGLRHWQPVVGLAGRTTG